MKQLLFMLSLLCATSTLATPVSQEQARQTAVQFVQQHFPTAQASSLRRAATQLQAVTSDTEAPYYVFNVGRQQGFVVVSGDDRTVPILGYVDHGDFDAASMPDNMRYFLGEYEAAILQLRIYGSADTAQQQGSRRADERTTIDPIVKVSYDQRAPYWNNTPVLDYGGRKNHAATGCVATAMAQVMATYRHPARTIAEIPAYEFTFQGETYPVSAVPADSAIHWELIADSYEEGYNGTPQEDAMAALMSLCGRAAEMQYGVNELGGSQATADKAANALMKYFDYEERTVRFVFRRNYSSANWERIIYAELQAGRPIIYSGQSPDNGHAFICDGYDAENKLFHINWGWGGVADGYFSLRLLNPQTLGTGGGTDLSGYGMTQTAIIGIQPDDGIATPAPQVLTVTSLNVQGSETIYKRNAVGQDFSGIKVCYEVCNWSGSANNFDVGLRIIDSKGNTVQDIADPQTQNRRFIVNGLWRTSLVSADYAVPVTVSGTLPDGDYRIIATSRVTGSGAMNPDAEADSRFVAFNITGENLYVLEQHPQPVFNLRVLGDVTVQPVKEGEAMVGKMHQAKVVIINDGTTYRDDIFYTINEIDPSSKDKAMYLAAYVEIARGESSTVNIYFKPTQEGTNTLRIYANDNKGNAHLLGMQAFTVSGAPDIHFYVTDIENYNTEQGAVVGNTLTMKVKIVNEGSVAFDGRYDWYLSYSSDEGNSWIDIQNMYPTFFNAFGIWYLKLGPSESEEKVMTWSGLDYARYHRVLFARYDNGYYMNNEMIRTEIYRLVDPATIRKPGDFNGDGEVNALDIQIIINACAAGSEDADYDVNADGQVDALDIQAVINLAANNNLQ